jgi:hypothetical protein
MAALWLYFSCFEECHSVAQELATQEGSYWHAILHRQEPDDWNAGYWFRRAGRHPVFVPLAEEAALIEVVGDVQLCLVPVCRARLVGKVERRRSGAPAEASAPSRLRRGRFTPGERKPSSR